MLTLFKKAPETVTRYHSSTETFFAASIGSRIESPLHGIIFLALLSRPEIGELESSIILIKQLLPMASDEQLLQFLLKAIYFLSPASSFTSGQTTKLSSYYFSVNAEQGQQTEDLLRGGPSTDWPHENRILNSISDSDSSESESDTDSNEELLDKRSSMTFS